MKTAVVICPGRGTYSKAELGALSLHFQNKRLLAGFDARREELGQETLSALDGAAAYSAARHGRGDNASPLIYAASLGDFLALDTHNVQIAAITGNSMGWYTALACAGALSPDAGFEVVNTMGALMQERLIGGQLIYPFTGEDWRPDAARKAELLALAAGINTRPGHILALSIDLGGMLALAGNEEGLKAFEACVPLTQGRFPMRLANHAAFHTGLQAPVAAQARSQLSSALFSQPLRPLIDGRGHVWWPGAVGAAALWDYTLGAQVTGPYDFSRAIITAAREFAPDLFIITGPGTTLGGAVAQSLILADWQGLRSKSDFQTRQAADPVIVSMGMENQRALVARR